MYVNKLLALCAAAALLAGCGGGSSGSSGNFALIEFIDSGKNEIPRNRAMEFRFSRPVAPDQDFGERLKIQNVQADGSNESNFSKAIGSYFINGEIVQFMPALPTKPDRSDAGMRADANYHVFLKGGPDSLRAESGESIPRPQEFLFDTNEFFEDAKPNDPPRALRLRAIDPVSGAATDLSRLDPRPFDQAQLDSATLAAAGRVITPGAGGAPEYATPWRFELVCSEALDPATINSETIQMHEIRSGAFTEAPATADPGHMGDVVSHRVPIQLAVEQGLNDEGQLEIRVIVTPAQTLVDNARYRLRFSGQILGIDFRKVFVGDNGITGDGSTLVDGSIYPEPGGLGYVSEFLVSDEPGITATRTLLYDPFLDGIEPEDGQTANSEEDINSALYNPASAPGEAVGFLSAFGNGADGPFAVNAAQTLDTGDTPNAPLGNPFQVQDLNPDDDYLNNTLPGRLLTYDSVEPYVLEVDSLTVSSAASLRITGVNPILFRVNGLVQITGQINIQGGNGAAGGGVVAPGGAAGAGGFAGASAKKGDGGSGICSFRSNSCTNFVTYLNNCQSAKDTFPASLNGNGPGRGLAGGEVYNDRTDDNKNGLGGGGGGGASHALAGTVGEDRPNATGAVGTSGPACSSFVNVRNSGVIGVRGQPGPTYGDREVITNNMGGSGGGAGGSTYVDRFGTNAQAGGAGGGGGGSLMIVAASSILVQGGVIDASGGAGGDGAMRSSQINQPWHSVSGGGGGGSGGTIALISGDNIDLTSSILSAEGGAGGQRGNVGTTFGCNACNEGGDGGAGFLFLMDADGEIDGFLPGGSATGDGEWDNDPRGVLTIRPFSTDRFSSIAAVTELFGMTAANPRYVGLNAETDVVGLVNPGQEIRIIASSSKGSADNPLVADPASELPSFEVAKLVYDSGSTRVIVTGDMADLNATPGSPDREAFVRIRSEFSYEDGVEAALGPFASIDTFVVTYRFNE